MFSLIFAPRNSLIFVLYDFPRDRSYAGMPISEVFSSDIGLGGVLSLLWFRRRLPDYATKFIEMILMVRHQSIPTVSRSRLGAFRPLLLREFDVPGRRCLRADGTEGGY